MKGETQQASRGAWGRECCHPSPEGEPWGGGGSGNMGLVGYTTAKQEDMKEAMERVEGDGLTECCRGPG